MKYNMSVFRHVVQVVRLVMMSSILYDNLRNPKLLLESKCHHDHLDRVHSKSGV